MAPTKRILKKTLKVDCEWSSCQESFSRMDNFCRHAEGHLSALVEEQPEEENRRDCLWRDCGFCSVEGPQEMRRHLFFHCYHTKLKQLGQQVLNTRPKIGTCSIGYQNRNVIPEIPDNFICLWEECEQPPYENPEWFYRHVEMHSQCIEIPAGEYEFPIRCGWKDCEATTKGRAKLREHLRSHTQEKLVACPGCGGMYANNTKLLRDHMRTHVSHYKCPLCDMTCPTPSALRNHIKFRHSNERPYSCEYCEYSCKNLVDLRKHLDTHSSEPAFHCDVPGCGFTYKQHDDGFLRLQLIRYESVELTEQLMRERQSRQGEEDEDDGMNEEEPSGAAPSELQVELRGVLLEEPEASAEEGGQEEEGMMYVLTGGLSPAEDSDMQQIHDSDQGALQPCVHVP
ncbi:hypothetical protein F7725_006594 [Dissostichus mawsoni]|uniref:C2H2-type domain-containing protein n=1 Tax=Dissostichus mawsoni TaxID=36200 RepID=A0A7J5XUF4_DISMA|nr:hypothetical protein F7725_006594 [Dissostichus mawsoni]